MSVWAVCGRQLGVLAVAALLAAALPVRANPASAVLRARASEEFYNLDREQALATFREAVAADPQDAAAYRGLASTLWLSITFHRGNMTVDDYLGKVTRRNTKPPPPPPDDRRRVSQRDRQGAEPGA